MKKRLGFLLVLVLAFCCAPALSETPEVSVFTAQGTGTGLSESSPPVTPFAFVRWGDSVETVAAAVSGETVGQEGETVVKSMGEIAGLAAPVPVTWYFRDGGLVRAEAVIANNLSKKIEKLTESGSGKPVNSATREFFQGLTDCYFYNGDKVLLFMAKESNASLRCRGDKSPFSLSLTYYQPAVFAAEKFGAVEGMVFQETGEDAQYYPSSPTTFVTPYTVTSPSALMYLVAVRQYQNPVRRIPYFSLSLYYAGNTDLGDGEKFSFLIDGKEYTFTGLTVENGENTGTEIQRIYNALIGEHSLPFWDALEKTENPVSFTFKGSIGTMNLESVPEGTLTLLKDGFRQYRELNGFSGMTRDYVSGGESPLTVMEMETILDTKAAYTMDQSVLPFAEMDWKVNANKLARDLGVKAEREGNVSRVQSVVSIENLGTDLPVTYTFRNNKLSAVVITLRKDIPNDAGFFDTPVGKQLTNYITSFIADHKKLDYTTDGLGMKYTRTDVTRLTHEPFL